MKTWQYSELLTKVENDLDLLDESFITAAEMLGYCNEAIQEAEAEIVKINEDYFLNSATLAWTAGTSKYAVPSDIYITKIRTLMYVNGTECYAIHRMRRLNEFETITEITNYDPQADYRYLVLNASATDGINFMFYPAPRLTGTFVTVWYIRTANRVTTGTDVVDIPEFVNFIMQYMKVRCYEKEGHPNLQMAMEALQFERKVMVDTLTEMVPDDQNEIQRDLTHYWEHT